MSHELTRLIAACDPDIFKRLLVEFRPDKVDAIDWSLSGRDLGRHVEQRLGADGQLILLFEQIGALAVHGGKSIVRSVLYNDRRLRIELDELDAGDETAAVWLASISSHYFDFALSALHAEQGLNKRSWRAFRVPFKMV